jgi:glutathione synthase/RimK-type ligase-like ATP-grasp enzyme
VKFTVLDYSVYDNWVDGESDRRIVEAAAALGIDADIAALERGKALPDCARCVWLRYDLRARGDLAWTVDLAAELTRRGHIVYPTAAAITCAEDKWETFAALRAADVPVLAHYRGGEFVACGARAVLKTRVGWGGMGMLRIDDTHAFEPPAGFAADDYVSQPFVPHECTWTVAATIEKTVLTLEKHRKESDFRTDGAFCREVRRVTAPRNGATSARAALRAAGLVAGTVDLIEARGRIMVLEVNSSPCLVYSELGRLDLALPMVRRVSAWMRACES